jgi:hypothetical protein
MTNLAQNTETNNSTVLEQTQSCYNPYFVTLSGKQKKVDSIKFYDHTTGEVLFSQNWFTDSQYGSNNETPKIIFPFTFIRKTEKDLNSVKPFYKKFQDQFNLKSDLHSVVLFIPVSMLDNFKVKKDVFQFETETDTNYRDYFYFDVVCVKELYKIDKENDKLIYYNSEEFKQTLTGKGHYKKVLKPLGEKVEMIVNAFKSAGIENAGRYEIEKMLTVCNIELINS